MARFIAVVLIALCGQAVAATGGDCAWAEPGRDPYTGGAARALLSFDHIAVPRRALLLAKATAGKPDDVVQIRRDSITGSPGMLYDPGIYDMHFAGGKRCGNVSRAGWSSDQAEIADVYRTGRWCAIRPRVCGNWFWTICDDMPMPSKQAAVRSVPEPSSLGLVALGLFGVLFAVPIWRSVKARHARKVNQARQFEGRASWWRPSDVRPGYEETEPLDTVPLERDHK